MSATAAPEENAEPPQRQLCAAADKRVRIIYGNSIVLNMHLSRRWRAGGADLRQLEKAEAKVFDRFWGKNMNELTQLSPEELREISREFRDLIYTMPFQIPQDFIFLARTVGILSGMCTGLDPLLNLWEHLAPFAGKLIAEEARNNREFWLEEVKVFVRTLLAYPVRVEGVLGKFERGEIAVQTPDIARQATRIEAAIRQGVLSILFSAFLLVGVLILREGTVAPEKGQAVSSYRAGRFAGVRE